MKNYRGVIDMPVNDDGRPRRYRAIRPKPKEGVAPPDDRTRQIILKAKRKYQRYGPKQLQAMLLNIEKHDIPLDVIIGVLNGK